MRLFPLISRLEEKAVNIPGPVRLFYYFWYYEKLQLLFNSIIIIIIIIICKTILGSRTRRVPCDIKNVDIDVEVVEGAIQSD